MARIGPVKLDLKVKGEKATVDVTYDILFSQTDIKKKQTYEEECRIIGDDTHRGDPPEAGGDDTLEFLSPLFNKPVKPKGDSETLSRRHKKTFRALDLNEDQGSIPNPDEIRALVTLRPTAGTGKPVQRQSPMVKLKMG
ncbi:MAG TPA: hypothetical protein VHF24_13000 [Acidimicrobiales bacterium]|nr:hypothetical protein [Acidimicrobiales bacterium]